VTFKELQKAIESQPDQSSPEFSQLLRRIRISGRGAFWYWDENKHRERDRTSKGDCCFNHIISVPRKDGKEMPLF
jgi:hypothetical protein